MYKSLSKKQIENNVEDLVDSVIEKLEFTVNKVGYNDYDVIPYLSKTNYYKLKKEIINILFDTLLAATLLKFKKLKISLGE